MKLIGVLLLLVYGISCTTSNAKEKNKSSIAYTTTIPDYITIEEAILRKKTEIMDSTEVIVQGVSWGVNEVLNGDVVLNLGDNAQKKDEIANFVCIFPSHQKNFVEIAKNNTVVKVKGRLKKTKYNVSLFDCKILSLAFPN